MKVYASSNLVPRNLFSPLGIKPWRKLCWNPSIRSDSFFLLCAWVPVWGRNALLSSANSDVGILAFARILLMRGVLGAPGCGYPSPASFSPLSVWCIFHFFLFLHGFNLTGFVVFLIFFLVFCIGCSICLSSLLLVLLSGFFLKGRVMPSFFCSRFWLCLLEKIF